MFYLRKKHIWYALLVTIADFTIFNEKKFKKAVYYSIDYFWYGKRYDINELIVSTSGS